MQALADYCGTTVEDIATQIMEKAYAKIEPVILDLAEKYKLEKDQISLVGVGGGASSLIIYFSNKMGVKYSIPGERGGYLIHRRGPVHGPRVVERIIPSPSKDDIRAIKTRLSTRPLSPVRPQSPWKSMWKSTRRPPGYGDCYGIHRG